MAHLKRHIPLVLALLALPAAAQSAGPKVSFKLGATPALGAGGDQHSKAGWTLGAEVALPFKGGQAFAGLNYRLFRPYEYEATQVGTGYAPGGATGQITTHVMANGIPVTNYQLDSGDFRKNNLEGFSLSLGYRLPVWAPLRLSAQGGLSLDALQSQQALNTAIRVVDPAVRNANPVPTGAKPLYADELFIQVQKTSIRPGAFLGLRSQVNRELFVEANLAWVGYATTNYVPFSYTGQASHVESINRTRAVVELCAGLTF